MVANSASGSRRTTRTRRLVTAPIAGPSYPFNGTSDPRWPKLDLTAGSWGLEFVGYGLQHPALVHAVAKCRALGVKRTSCERPIVFPVDPERPRLRRPRCKSAGSTGLEPQSEP